MIDIYEELGLDPPQSLSIPSPSPYNSASSHAGSSSNSLASGLSGSLPSIPSAGSGSNLHVEKENPEKDKRR